MKTAKLESIKCKKCNESAFVAHYGTSNNKQRYHCKKCNYTFFDNKAMPGMKFPARIVGTAIAMRYEGMSLADISYEIWNRYEVQVSRITIYNWINRFRG